MIDCMKVSLLDLMHIYKGIHFTFLFFSVGSFFSALVLSLVIHPHYSKIDIYTVPSFSVILHHLEHGSYFIPLYSNHACLLNGAGLEYSLRVC